MLQLFTSGTRRGSLTSRRMQKKPSFMRSLFGWSQLNKVTECLASSSHIFVLCHACWDPSVYSRSSSLNQRLKTKLIFPITDSKAHVYYILQRLTMGIGPCCFFINVKDAVSPCFFLDMPLRLSKLRYVYMIIYIHIYIYIYIYIYI